MKIQRFLIALFLCTSAFVTLSARSSLPIIPKKIYVDEQNVKLASRGIVMIVNKHTFRFKALRANKNGLFVLKKDLLLSPRASVLHKKIYQCDVCGLKFSRETDLAWHYLEKHAK